jgi:hypothetical protein
MARRGKADGNKKAMFAEAKDLESKGLKQKRGVPPDEATTPIKGKGPVKGGRAPKEDPLAGMIKGAMKGKPPMGKKTEMPEKMMKKSKKKVK